MRTRITLELEQEEREAMQVLARQEMRGLKDQIRYVIREAAQRHGLLPGISELHAKENHLNAATINA